MKEPQDRLTSFTWDSGRCHWLVMSRSHHLSVGNLQDASFLIAVSLRNPRFSNRWLRAVIDDALEIGEKVRICLVDTPYFERVTYGSQETSLQVQKLTSLYKETSQKEQQISNVLSSYPSQSVDVFRWRDVERVVPVTLFDELHAAFVQRQRIYDFLCEQVRIGTKLETVPEIEEASIFLLREVPVLAFLYYSLFPGTIDVYPGDQADFFWQLEAGLLEQEAPLMTRLAQGAPPSVYANVSHIDK